MSKLHYMPVYHDDLISSDEWLLDDAIFGVYMKFIVCLNQKGGELPYDIPFLVKKLGCKKKNLVTLLQILAKKEGFLQVFDGKITLTKVAEVVAEQHAKHQKRVNAGRLGGFAKAAGASNATAMPAGLPWQPEPEPEPEPRIYTPLTPQGGDAGQGPRPVTEKKIKVKKEIEIPSIEMVAAYMLERGFVAANYWAAQFVNHYESKNWRQTSGKQLTDWRAAVRGPWDKNRFTLEPSPHATRTNQGGGVSAPHRTRDGLLVAFANELRELS